MLCAATLCSNTIPSIYLTNTSAVLLCSPYPLCITDMLWRPTQPDLMWPFACFTLQDTGTVLKGLCHEIDIFLKDSKIKSVHLICALKVFKLSLLLWYLILNFLLAAMILLILKILPVTLSGCSETSILNMKTLVVLKYHNGSRPVTCKLSRFFLHPMRVGHWRLKKSTNDREGSQDRKWCGFRTNS